MSNHLWIQENLAAFLAGGLTADERTRFEKHCADCVACARALAAARKMEDAMAELFTDARPDAGLEERMIEHLQKTPPRRRDWPMWLRFVGGAAAALLFGLVGGGLHFFVALAADNARTQSTNNLRQLALMVDGEKDERARPPEGFDADTGKDKQEQNRPPMDSFAREDRKLATLNLRDGANELRDGLGIDRLEDLKLPELNMPIRNSTLSMDGSGGSAGGGGAAPGGGQGWYFPPVNGTISNGRNHDSGKLGTITDGRVPAQAQAGEKVETMFSRAGSKLGEAAEKSDPATSSAYYKFSLRAEPESRTPPPPVVSPPVSDIYANMSTRAEQTVKVIQEAQKKEEALQAKELPVGGQKQPEPAQAERKIIRTGDMEFEIEGYDAAAATIAKLTEGLKGAYIESDDSTRQANGKKRGVIVVRVPPTGLSKFIADLRTELGKMGELKSQRLGSQDVSKQYIDTEGNLRVAKAMEERFLDIIKNRKGEIKDLIAAENALGEWRTKIERMVGEMRYYEKQIALGTLTITLSEKELQAPSALVVTEKIGMHIEVEEVEKAHQAALAAVTEVKGRVAKSELKQFAQGHLKAIVHMEVAPPAAPGLAEKLKKLGIVTHHSAERKQEARGGAGKPLELKPTVSDVAFEVELYNAANIRPREAFKMAIATLDVVGHYRKLQEAVAKVKGQVREGKLNERDKLNIAAQFDFDIQTSDKPAIDKAIADVGPLLSRSTEQAPVNELATDRKVGYRLILQNVAGTQPRERVALVVEVANVEAKAAEVKSFVLAAQGIVVDSKLRHETNGTVTVAQVFDVPLGANATLLAQIKKSGVRSQQAITNPQAPENELATARIELTLTNGNLIVPSDAGVGAHISKGLALSFWFFSQCLIFLITGVLVVVPCVAGVIFLVRFLVWAWKRSAAKA